MSRPSRKKLINLVATSKSNRELAKNLDVSHETIRNWLRHYDIDRKEIRSIPLQEKLPREVIKILVFDHRKTLKEISIFYGYRTLVRFKKDFAKAWGEKVLVEILERVQWNKSFPVTPETLDELVQESNSLMDLGVKLGWRRNNGLSRRVRQKLAFFGLDQYIERLVQSYEWSDEVIASLDKFTAQEIANRVGCTPHNVARERKKRGVKLHNYKKNWKQDEIDLLGTDTDKNIAERLNCSLYCVRKKRIAMGKTSYHLKKSSLFKNSEKNE